MGFKNDLLCLIFKRQSILELVIIYFFPKISLILISIYIIRNIIIKLTLKSVDYSSLQSNDMKMFTFNLSSNRDKQFVDYKEKNRIIKLERNNNVLIKVYSSSLNPADIKIQKGSIPFFRWTFLINENPIGGDFAGEIVAIGKKVKKFKIGDEVVGRTWYGVIQEYTQVDENSIVLKPKSVSFDDAASLPAAALTSYESLIYFYEEKNLKGKNVLVIGASGGCGLFGVQLSKILGANYIVGVCSTKNKNYVLENGANSVIEYNKENYIEELKKLNIKFDLVYDTVDPKTIKYDYYEIFKDFFKEDGKYIAINGKGFRSFPNIIKSFFGDRDKNIRKKAYLLFYNKHIKDLEVLLNFVEEGKLKPVLNIVDFDKDNIQKGIDLLASKRTIGKIVFKLIDKK